jgi:hypothetical protein
MKRRVPTARKQLALLDLPEPSAKEVNNTEHYFRAELKDINGNVLAYREFDNPSRRLITGDSIDFNWTISLS